MTDPWHPHPKKWTKSQVKRWNAINKAAAQNVPLLNDPWIETLYDLAFNTPRGQISGDLRAAAIEYFEQYMMDTYGIRLRDVFDWRTWREEYAEG